jgi:hypothetical protein
VSAHRQGLEEISAAAASIRPQSVTSPSSPRRRNLPFWNVQNAILAPMLPDGDATLLSLRTRLLQGMREYMAEGEPSYAESDVRECENILMGHLQAVESAADRAEALRHVHDTVLRLNELNSRCGGELIETDQREDICALIIRAGSLRGFNAEDEDVTEQWRDW